jgi:hypothetical protein
MGNLGTGAGRVETFVTETSFLPKRQPATKFMVQGIFERGIPDEPIEIASLQDFSYYLGKPIHDSGLEILQGVKLGATFIVFPIARKVTTVLTAGSKAQVVVSGITFRAKNNGIALNGTIVTITEPVSGTPSVVDIIIAKPDASPYTISDVPATLTSGVRTTFNAAQSDLDIVESTGTFTTGLNGTLSGGIDDIVGVALQGTKATATIGAVSFEAKMTGAGYNGITIEIATPLSRKSNVVDIIETVAGFTPNRITDVPTTLSQSVIDKYNVLLLFSSITTTSGTISTGTATLTSGVKDISLIDNNDILGNSAYNTGLYSFRKATYRSRNILQIVKQDRDIDSAYILFAEQTGRFVDIFAPKDQSEQVTTAYRLATSPYSGTAYNSWNAAIWAGGVKLKNPVDALQSITLVGAGNLAAIITDKNQNNPFASVGNNEYNKLKAVDGVIRNFEGNAKNNLYDNEVNMFINDYGTITADQPNRTLWRDTTSLRRYRHVAELILLIQDSMLELGKKYRNQILTPELVFAPMYRDALTYIRQWEDGNAIVPDENVGWQWIGDQDVTNINEVTYNTLVDLAQQIYRVKFRFKPNGMAEFIGIEINVNSLNVTFEA